MNYQVTNLTIHQAVKGLCNDLGFDRELFRESAHQALVVGLHTQTLSLFVWVLHVEAKWK